MPEPVAQVENRAIAGPEGEIPIRIYTPTGNGPFPLVVYFQDAPERSSTAGLTEGRRPRLTKSWADAAYRGQEWAGWCKAHGD